MGSPPRLTVLGDMLLDVAVAGALGESREAAGSVSLHAGGSAANFAVGAATAGALVRFVGRVGNDVAGRLLVAELQRAGVTPYIETDRDLPTGHVLVLQDIDGQGGNRMLSEAGASRRLAPGCLRPEWFRDIHGLHLTGYSFLRSGSTPAAARAALQLCRLHSPSALLSVDPAPAHLIRDFGPALFLELLSELEPDILLPNLEEGQVLTGEAEPRAVAQCLREQVARTVVLKLGPDGCLLCTDAGIQAVGAVPTEVVDTTGAGDAFAAAFVVELHVSQDALAATRAASMAAARVVGRAGPR